ncbi:hypothetical protein [Glutamicibacter sp. NPDC087344]|uniref:hypothetical protein n=1 Tax=Glutamicibacter sp. NPDC087344 TaxID=3363994 RepID=UPI0037F9DADB
MKITKQLSLKIVCLAAFSLVMTGCAQGGSYEGKLISEAKPHGNIVLPQRDLPMESWEHVAVVCPYSSASADLPAPMKRVVEQLDTDSGDQRQWLVFGQGDDAQSVELTRSKVDFCSENLDYSKAFPADQQWSVQEGPEGIMEISPAYSSGASS